MGYMQGLRHYVMCNNFITMLQPWKMTTDICTVLKTSAFTESNRQGMNILVGKALYMHKKARGSCKNNVDNFSWF